MNPSIPETQRLDAIADLLRAEIPDDVFESHLGGLARQTQGYVHNVVDINTWGQVDSSNSNAA